MAFIGSLLGTSIANSASPYGEVLAYWRFEKVQHLKADSTSLSIVGQSLTVSDRGPIEPQPFVFDESGRGIFWKTKG